MKVFCPNCGSDNEGMPGGRVTCRACTASFEVPRSDATGGPAPAPQPPPVSQPWPGLSSTPNPPPPSSSGWVGPNPSSQPLSSFSSPTMPVKNNTLAIVSLVLGILCCIPFASLGAIITGVIARNQIAASNGQQKGGELATAGIVLGALGIALGLLWFIVGLAGR